MNNLKNGMVFNELLALVSSNNAPSVCIDSRLVKTGDIFVAIKGTVYNGSNFIDHAIANGAEYIVAQQLCRCDSAEVVIVDDAAKAAADLAQASKGYPASKLTNMAITGTNGKTTVAFLVRSIIQNAGEKCGLIGTIVYDTGSASRKATLTTPDCLAIAKEQQKMLKANSKYMVIEASSHSLAQNRLAGINFNAAAFTNLTGDHLDYHKTQKDYFAAKAKLFQELSLDSTAILNKESPEAEQIAELTKAKILWYAIDRSADINACIKSMDITGTVFIIEYSGQKQTVQTPLPGRHNISNHLAAAGLCLAAGFDLQTIADGLSALKTIPGRLEKLDWVGVSVFVDYAHTDDALKNVLSTLKPLCKGKLIIVFGCGGDRDKTKRPRMAKVAEQSADFIVVTSDNPRTERPEDIIDDISTGFENPNSETIIIEPDRKKAIELAINTAAKNDAVLIAGKGHETYQIIGKQKLDFSDKAIAMQFLKKRK